MSQLDFYKNEFIISPHEYSLLQEALYKNGNDAAGLYKSLLEFLPLKTVDELFEKGKHPVQVIVDWKLG